ncbi:hypothetical protein ACS0TY_026120 [Phlomoides rotata]
MEVYSYVVAVFGLAAESAYLNKGEFCRRRAVVGVMFLPEMGPKLQGQQKLSYNCLDMAFSPYDDYWREVRKIGAIHLLSLKKIQSFRPTREDEISRMVTKILGFASSNQALNLSEIAMTLGSTMICRIAFGKRYDEDGFELKRFEKILHEAQAMMAAFFVSDYFPSFGWVDKLSGLCNRLDETFKSLDTFYQELIDEHLDRKRARSKVEGEDILDILIQLKEEKACSFDLDWDHIKALLMNIFVAATDTSAASTVWTMTALMKTPKVMKKVQTEIRNLIGKKGKVDEDDLPNLPYLKAVICETLRLYPPAPLLVPRETMERCTLEGYEIQPRTLVHKYGPIMQMKIGSVPILVISSPKLAKEVLKSQDLAFCSRPKLQGQQKLSYNCLDMAFSPYDDYWREVRKIGAIHLLSLKKIQSFRPTREDEISRMVTKILGFASSNQALNLSEIAMTLGSTMICRIAFGKRYDEDGFELKRFEKILHEAQAMMAAFFVSDYFPSFGWSLDTFYQELIDEHLDRKRARSKEEGEDILDILIQLKEEKACSFDLDWDHIKALLMNIFVAATDTSAASTVWTMTALMKTPKVMKKVQTEIRNLIGKKGKVDEDDLPNLPYLKAVICETLRLYPPAPLLVPRETMERCTLEGYEIQPRTLVHVLDGCFIIELIGYEVDEIQNYRTFHSLQRDLVLLENQIPFFVLCELFDLIRGPEQHGLLMKGVLLFCINGFPGYLLYMPERRSEEVKHILDLIQTNWYPSPPYNTSTATLHDPSFIIPTATQLKDANVKFERKEYDRVAEMFRKRRGTTVFDVEFNQDSGFMSMPALVIEDDTESLLRNLIAYEQFFSIHEPAPVTDYALLLDCLINSSKDVQILCQHGIIRNCLSSDQEVADIVNRLCEKITYYSDNMMYVDMFNGINTHHKNPWNRAMAVYHRNYFTSPWEYVLFGPTLVLDGCFIIELIGYEVDEIQNYRTFHSLQRDLVLLENQIPFFVLCELFDLIRGPEQHGLLMKGVLLFCINGFPGYLLYMPERRSEEVKHILDLIQTNWYPSPPYNTSTATLHDPSFIIPTATQLKDANVKFERKEYDRVAEMFRKRRGTTVFDVEFNQDSGFMSMPALVIEDDTESLLRNLIAYEQFFSIHEPAPVTDYALLLDCLINSSKDVQILCQHGIIRNCLSSDQEVADIVNRLCEKITYYSDNMMYVDMFNGINTHHKNPWNRAMAVYHRNYFTSPWEYVDCMHLPP